MTVPATTRRAGPFIGNGVTTSFPFTYKTFATSDLAVTRTLADGLESSLVLNSDYSVTLNGDQDASPGGSITYPISGTPLASGEKLTVVGATEYDQTADLPTGGAFSPVVIENALDRATIQIQQLAEVAGRALTLPPSAASASATLPAPESSKVIGWDEAAQALVNYAPADFATVVVNGTSYTDIFSGTGAQTAFVLQANPGSVNALDIAISGVSQVNGVDFTVSGTTLTFASPPPAGTGNIAVRYVVALPVGTVNAQDVVYNSDVSGAVSTTVQGHLRDNLVSIFDALTAVQIADVKANTALYDLSATIAAVINALPAGATLHFPRGAYRCDSEILISGKVGITLRGSRGAKLRFTDGAYIGLHFASNSQHCVIEGFRIWGTNTLTPAITLVKFTGASAYPTVRDCNFAYADIAVLCGATYVVKLIGNAYSNCDTYVKAITTEGGTADLLMLGETFGTSLIGTDPLVDLQFVYARLDGCYFETESRTKYAVHTRDISGNPELHYGVTGCQFFQSGAIYVDGASNLVFTGNTTQRCYHSANLHFIRITASASATITGNMMSMNAIIAGLAGISCSGTAVVTGNTIRQYDTGAAFAAGICDANVFTDCTIGVSTGVGSVAVVGNTNSFVNCGTDLANASTTAFAPRAITVTLTGCTTAPTGSARYEVDNGVVTLTLPALSATSNSTACTITGLSGAITPDGISVFGSVVLILDNGVQSVEQVGILSTGVIELRKNGSATGFTGSGTKGVRECVITYRLRNV